MQAKNILITIIKGLGVLGVLYGVLIIIGFVYGYLLKHPSLMILIPIFLVLMVAYILGTIYNILNED